MDRIGCGGTAEIFKAKLYGPEGFEKILAIKRILPHLNENIDFIQMLIDEAKIAVQLSHKNIVQVYDLGMVEEDYFIAMEYIEGMNLRAIAQKMKKLKRKIPLGDALFIVIEMCRALDYAHRKKDIDGKPWKIVHRDISPPNILVTREGEVKVVDFGIAKAASKITETVTGVLKGKLAYMSPEQARGDVVDHRSDLFSTGIVLYELITHKSLFKRDNGMKSLELIKNFSLASPFLPADVPSELEYIIMRALQRNRKKRYQTAKEFEIDLNKLLYSSSIESKPDNLVILMEDLYRREKKSKKQKVKEKDFELDSQTRREIAKADQTLIVTRSADSTPQIPHYEPSKNPEADIYTYNTRVLTLDGKIEVKNKRRRTPSTHPIMTSIKNAKRPKKQKTSVKEIEFQESDFGIPNKDKTVLYDNAPSFNLPTNTNLFQRSKTSDLGFPIEEMYVPQKEGHYDFTGPGGPPITLERPILNFAPKPYPIRRRDFPKDHSIDLIPPGSFIIIGFLILFLGMNFYQKLISFLVPMGLNFYNFCWETLQEILNFVI